MKILVLILVFVLSSFSAYSQNILISDTLKPNEPSIVIDPNHPNRIYAGANIDGVYWSLDTGRTWHIGRMFSSFGVWGDPVLIVDTLSTVYFFHLSNVPGETWIDRLVCQKMKFGETYFDDGRAIGLNGTKQQDKEWAVVDRNNNNIYMTWTQFDRYGSTNPTHRSNILFSKSTDEGESWTTPKAINLKDGSCLDDDYTVEGSVPAVGPNGEIFVAWSGEDGIYFDRSTDQGVTWLVNDIIVDDQPGGWVFSVPGLNRCNGMPVTKCDLSGGENHGTIYINWTDQRYGEDDTDVWLTKSTDGGFTWAEPKRVNDDPSGSHNFLTWMAIDQTTGYLYFVFYDRRNHPDNYTDVYLAVSTDGGETFLNRKISEEPFRPINNVFFGDYTNIDVVNGVVRPIWTRMDGKYTSIWTHLTTHEELVTSVEEERDLPNIISTKNYPNPAKDFNYISFKIKNRSRVSISLINSIGQELAAPVRNQEYEMGKYTIPIDLCSLGLTSGFYYYIIRIDNKIKIEKLIIANK